MQQRIVADHEIAAFLPLCESVARRYNGLQGAEYDDLRQEAMICVWDMLKFNYWPVRYDVENRCKNYVNKCRHQRGDGV